MHTLKLEKTSLRRLNSKVISRNISSIIERALNHQRRAQGWSVRDVDYHAITPKWRDGAFVYTVDLNFSKHDGIDLDAEAFAQFATLAKIVESAANSYGRWAVVEINGQSNRHKYETGEKSTTIPEIKLPPIDSYFKDIYDRDAQIEILHSSIHACLSSNRANRFHTVLYGPPGCGKTDILLRFADMFSENDVLKFDATSTTKAGAEKYLLDTENIPLLLLVEEIEKTEEASLRWLLSVLDHRAEIRKTNFRGVQQRRVPMLCFATVNDLGLFERVMSGALASRFSNKLYCPRPNYRVLRRILKREISKVNGRVEWIDPTIEYCEKHGIDDPRQVITICLCGGDKLLDGRYQGYLDKTRGPEKGA